MEEGTGFHKRRQKYADATPTPTNQRNVSISEDVIDPLIHRQFFKLVSSACLTADSGRDGVVSLQSPEIKPAVTCVWTTARDWSRSNRTSEVLQRTRGNADLATQPSVQQRKSTRQMLIAIVYTTTWTQVLALSKFYQRLYSSRPTRLSPPLQWPS